MVDDEPARSVGCRQWIMEIDFGHVAQTPPTAIQLSAPEGVAKGRSQVAGPSDPM